MKENSVKVLNYVKEMDGVKDITANDIAEATGLTARSVNGIVTAAFQRHTKVVDGNKVAEPLMERVAAEVEVEDGTHKQVKFIKLTDAGRAFEAEVDAE